MTLLTRKFAYAAFAAFAVYLATDVALSVGGIQLPDELTIAAALCFGGGGGFLVTRDVLTRHPDAKVDQEEATTASAENDNEAQ